MEWGAADEENWWILSRCGECGARAEVVTTNAQAAWYDLELDRQMAAMTRAADRLGAGRTDARHRRAGRGGPA
jgi:hypothetical protein